jgi:hypothetical protein
MANKTDLRTLQLIKKKAVAGGGGAVTSVNGNVGVVVLATDDISDGGQVNKYVTAADLVDLGNLSGTNTGDQTSIVGITGTLAQFNTALTGADFATGGGTASGTNTGDQTSIVGITGTKAQFDTAVTDGNIQYVGDAPTSHTHPQSDITSLVSDLAAKQPLDASLTAYAALTTAANQIIYYTAADTPVVTTISTLGRNLIDDGNTGSMHTTLALDTLTLDYFANPTASLDFAQQQTLQFVIENRTSDPGSPVTGQMWLRTDL